MEQLCRHKLMERVLSLKDFFLYFSFSLILCMGVGFVFVHPTPYLHDFLEWTYQAWLVNQIWLHVESVEAVYHLANHPVPNSTAQILMAAFMLLISPTAAAKLGLSLYFVACAWMSYRIYKRNNDALQVFLVVALIFFGPGFWNGYINNQIALLVFTSYLIGLNSTNRLNSLRILLYSMALFFSHAVVFAVFIMFVFVDLMLHPSLSIKQKILKSFSLVPSGVLILWYGLIKIMSSSNEPRTGMSFFDWAQYKVYTLAKQGPFHNFVTGTGESLLADYNWFYMFGFVTNFMFACAFVYWFIWIVRQIPRTSKDFILLPMRSYSISLFVTISFCTIIFLIAGAKTFGVVNFGERFFVSAVLIFFLSFQFPSRLKELMAGVASVFSVYFVVIAFSLPQHASKPQVSVNKHTDGSTEQFIDSIYSNSEHRYFNHRVFIFYDKGLALQSEEPEIKPLAFDTSIVKYKN